jgi:hypothetical protein
MLTGNRGKFLGIILGVPIAALPIAPQADLLRPDGAHDQPESRRAGRPDLGYGQERAIQRFDRRLLHARHVTL